MFSDKHQARGPDHGDEHPCLPDCEITRTLQLSPNLVEQQARALLNSYPDIPQETLLRARALIPDEALRKAVRADYYMRMVPWEVDIIPTLTCADSGRSSGGLRSRSARLL